MMREGLLDLPIESYEITIESQKPITTPIYKQEADNKRNVKGCQIKFKKILDFKNLRLTVTKQTDHFETIPFEFLESYD